MLELDNIQKNFGNKQVLKGISYKFQYGSIYGVMGRNGAGKTTLFNCLAGLENYTGQIKSNYPILKKHLAYLPTNPSMISYITGKEYLQFVTAARGTKDVDFEKKNIFNLPLEAYAEKYSTGMQKKLAFWGLVINDNDIYILDEPFNGVDLESYQLMSQIILKLKDLNKLIIISSHILESLTSICDEIISLDAGLFSNVYDKSDFGKLITSERNSLSMDKIANLFL